MIQTLRLVSAVPLNNPRCYGIQGVFEGVRERFILVFMTAEFFAGMVVTRITEEAVTSNLCKTPVTNLRVRVIFAI